jgi:flagellar basal-body rod protein FlgF
MIYGLYLSATGVVTNAYRQDVIANNLANSETVGFKRDLAMFRQRLPADQEDSSTTPGLSNALLDKIGGGTFAEPTLVDRSDGALRPTDNPADVAITGPGFFTVAGKDNKTFLTRDGRFRLNTAGKLTLMNDQSDPVLDAKGQPIQLDPTSPFSIDSVGNIHQNNQIAGQLGVVDVGQDVHLSKAGDSLLSVPDGTSLTPINPRLQDSSVEESNVDPATELAQLMDTQRALEANANMIHYQDTTLGELINTVGKVS